MSGFFGAIDFGGGELEQRFVQRAAARLAKSAPDGVTEARPASAAFVHASLRTSDVPGRETGIACLRDTLWIVCDARIDGRDDLIDSLEANCGRRVRSASDAELILHLYTTRGEAGLDELTGDFAFAIWDSRARRMVAARDAFGVKPFYYARIGETIAFSTDQACVLDFPGVDDETDEEVVADFLVAGENPRLDSTFYRGVGRLPPAHRLHADPRGVQLAERAPLADVADVRFGTPAEYVEAFRHHLRRAVADRLTGERASLLLSGGVDSTAVAATATDVLRARGTTGSLLGLTFVYERLIAHDEGRYARMAAEELGIPIRQLALDDYELYPRAGSGRPAPIQPSLEPIAAGEDLCRAASDHGRIVLTGEGGDPALHCPPTYLPRLLARGRFPRAFGEAFRHISEFGRPPSIGIRTLAGRLSRRDPFEDYPSWIDPDFESRTHLRDRWRAWRRAPAMRREPHPTRPETIARLRGYVWTNEFEFLDPAVTGSRIEFRHPFFDLRLLRFLLGIPAIPWCIHKEIVRRAMTGRLPDAVRNRPKAPLSATPSHRMTEAGLRAATIRLRQTDGFDRFVRPDAIVAEVSRGDGISPARRERCFAALGLADWLHARAPFQIQRRETGNARPQPQPSEGIHESVHA